jgi:hypothetical protein
METRYAKKRGAKLLEISRFLTPENRADLLAWVRLAHFAENSARKSLNLGTAIDGYYPEGNPSDYLEVAEQRQAPASPDK